MKLKPSDSFFKLMSAAQEQGIKQCKESFHVGDPERPISVCVIGLTYWGLNAGIVTDTEIQYLREALPPNPFTLNDAAEWTFADFYSYLQSKEEEEETEEKNAPPNLEIPTGRHI